MLLLTIDPVSIHIHTRAALHLVVCPQYLKIEDRKACVCSFALEAYFSFHPTIYVNHLYGMRWRGEKRWLLALKVDVLAVFCVFELEIQFSNQITRHKSFLP